MLLEVFIFALYHRLLVGVLQKLKIKSEHEKELAEIITQVNAKYEAKNQEADASFMKKNKLVETYINRVLMNKVLAEAYRSKCQDLSPICSSDFPGIVH